jgi:CO dehydrogenase/acetyl-CoA synthase gamma subunit (corrinoid Fe-S protein)
MITAVEIYKLLPKTNCGDCGTHNCFGFAARLASHLASPDDCPMMTEAARKILHETTAAALDSPGTVYEPSTGNLKAENKGGGF